MRLTLNLEKNNQITESKGQAYNLKINLQHNNKNVDFLKGVVFEKDLTSKNIDGPKFPQLYFFQPKKVFLFSKTQVTLSYLNMVDDELQDDWGETFDIGSISGGMFRSHEDPHGLEDLDLEAWAR